DAPDAARLAPRVSRVHRPKGGCRELHREASGAGRRHPALHPGRPRRGDAPRFSADRLRPRDRLPQHGLAAHRWRNGAFGSPRDAARSHAGNLPSGDRRHPALLVTAADPLFSPNIPVMHATTHTPPASAVVHPLIVGRRRGFTLDELLTVIAIIGILAAIIIPVVGKVRQSARVTQSVANLRGIGQAVLLYAGENRHTLPPLVDLSESGGFGSQYWSRTIEPYLEPAVDGGWRDLNNRAFRQSPALVSPLLEDGRHHAIGDYGANRDVIQHPNSAPRRLSEITRPGNTVMVAAAETR